MKTLFSFVCRPQPRRADPRPGMQSRSQAQDRNQPFPLTRTYVETGDERCPLAGIWSHLPHAIPTPDEPESAWPALRGLPPWRAFHLFVTLSRYRTV